MKPYLLNFVMIVINIKISSAVNLSMNGCCLYVLALR